MGQELSFLQAAVLFAILVNQFANGQSGCTTGDVRLVGGSDNLEGRVEVCSDGAWGTVCDDGWTTVEASVVCRQLGFSHEDAVARDAAYYGRGTGSIFLDDVSCSGFEDRLVDCTHRGIGTNDCNHYEDAGVVCAPLPNVTFIRNDLSHIETDIEAIRLVNGDTNYMGRLEVLYNGTWGSVCDDFWSYSDAKVACKMLGYDDAVCAVTSNQFGTARSSVPFWMDNVQCLGTEEALDDCSFPGWANNNCNHNVDDAGVVCKSENATTVGVPYNIRLVNSSTRSLSLSWTVPTYPSPAQYLRFTISYKARGWLNPSTATVYPTSGARQGSTVNYTLGSLTRNTSYDIQVRAQVQFAPCSTTLYGAFSDSMTFRTSNTLKHSNFSVRLVSPYAGVDFLGRVEVLYNGQWGTICSRLVNTADTNVLCRMAGFPGSTCIVYSARLGRGSGQIWLDGPGCSYGDEVLEDCNRLNWGNYHYTCDHSDDIGVICTPKEGDIPSVRNFAVRSTSGTSVSVSWEPYTFPRGVYYSRFEIWYSYISGSWRRIVVSGSATEYTLNNLALQQQYLVSIRPRMRFQTTCYSYTYGPYSPQVNITTVESAPDGPPSVFHIVTINNTAIEAQWGLPALGVRNGIIRGYKLFVNSEGRDEMVVNVMGNSTEAYIIGGLQPRTAYTVSILAYTAPGDGPRSIRLTTVTRAIDRTPISGFGIGGNNVDLVTRGYFSSRIYVHCTTRDTSPNTTVKWFLANGTKIRSRTVTSSQSNLQVIKFGNGTTALVLGAYRGLTYCEGGKYTCAVNTSSGRSERRTFHLKVGSSVPQPSQPTYTRRGGNFVILSWSESFCDGGHDISSFEIRYRRSSYYYYGYSYSFITVSNPTQRSYTIRGLSSSTSYQFSIRVIASDGRTSSYSSTISISTLSTPPSAPRNVVARLARPLVVQVSWTQSSSSYGAITQYRVYATPIAVPLQRKKRQASPVDVIEKVFPGTATSGNITLPHYSVLYQFQVSAARSSGLTFIEGSPSSVTSSTTVFIPEPGLPKPTNVRIMSSTNASLTVSWNYPPPPIGTVITNFFITYSGNVESRSPRGNLIQFENSGEATVNDTSVTLSPLIPGTNYQIKVSAISLRGRGEEVLVSGNVQNSGQDGVAYFQLRLSPIGNCHNYLDFGGDTTERLMSVRSAVLRQLTRMCPRCSLTTANIRDDEFSCRGGLTNHIVYRAMITGTTAYSPTDLVSLLQSWVESGTASIFISSTIQRLFIDEDCQTRLDTLWDPNCLPPVTTTGTAPAAKPTISTSTGAVSGIGAGVVGGVVLAVVIFLLVLVFLIVLIVTIVMWKSTKKEGRAPRQSAKNSSNRESTHYVFSDTDSTCKEEYTLT